MFHYKVVRDHELDINEICIIFRRKIQASKLKRGHLQNTELLPMKRQKKIRPITV
jgi:hypothetical protein